VRTPEGRTDALPAAARDADARQYVLGDYAIDPLLGDLLARKPSCVTNQSRGLGT